MADGIVMRIAIVSAMIAKNASSSRNMASHHQRHHQRGAYNMLPEISVTRVGMARINNDQARQHRALMARNGKMMAWQCRKCFAHRACAHIKQSASRGNSIRSKMMMAWRKHVGEAMMAWHDNVMAANNQRKSK